MGIDFVGFVKIDEEEVYVINPYYTIAEYISTGCGGKWSLKYADPTIFWRRIYSNTERRLIEKVGLEPNADLKHVLMIYKALIRLNPYLQNEIVSSYYVKNIALLLGFNGLQREVAKVRMYDCTDHEVTVNITITDNTDLSSWTRQRTSLQLIEMTKYMYKFVIDGKMPWAFEPQVFLHFDTNDQKKSETVNIPQLRKGMEKYLREIIHLVTENWSKLIQDAEDST